MMSGDIVHSIVADWQPNLSVKMTILQYQIIAQSPFANAMNTLCLSCN